MVVTSALIAVVAEPEASSVATPVTAPPSVAAVPATKVRFLPVPVTAPTDTLPPVRLRVAPAPPRVKAPVIVTSAVPALTSLLSLIVPVVATNCTAPLLVVTDWATVRSRPAVIDKPVPALAMLMAASTDASRVATRLTLAVAALIEATLTSASPGAATPAAAVQSRAAPLAVMLMSRGSSSKVPTWPLSAEVSTAPW